MFAPFAGYPRGLGAATKVPSSGDPTPIAAGTWCTVGFYQNLLGGFLSFVDTSWTDLATTWAGMVGFPQGQLLIRDSTAYQDAVLQFQVTNDTTVAEVYSMLNAISADVSVRVIWINGPEAGADILTQQEAANTDALADLFADPIGTLARLPGDLANDALSTLFVPLLVTGGLVLLAVKQAEGTRTYRKYVA